MLLLACEGSPSGTGNAEAHQCGHEDYRWLRQGEALTCPPYRTI